MTRPLSLPETLGVRDRVLRCNACAQTKSVSPDEMLQYAKTQWPRCCEEVMTLLVPSLSGRVPRDSK